VTRRFNFSGVGAEVGSGSGMLMIAGKVLIGALISLWERFSSVGVGETGVIDMVACTGARGCCLAACEAAEVENGEAW
jgi:hypothetical protein